MEDVRTYWIFKFVCDFWTSHEYFLSRNCRYGHAYRTLQPRVTKTLLHTFLDSTKTLAQHYGAIRALAAIGPSVVCLSWFSLFLGFNIHIAFFLCFLTSVIMRVYFAWIIGSMQFFLRFVIVCSIAEMFQFQSFIQLLTALLQIQQQRQKKRICKLFVFSFILIMQVCLLNNSIFRLVSLYCRTSNHTCNL